MESGGRDERLELCLLEAVLPEDKICCDERVSSGAKSIRASRGALTRGAVLAVVEEGDHAIGVHPLAGVL